jgi:hypothetical protein
VTPAMHEPTGSSSARPELTIERLRLRAAGLDDAAARTFARLVAARLTPGLLRPAGGAGVGAGVGAGDVHVQVAARRGETPEKLAERTAAAIAAALARGTAGVDAGGLP